MPFEERPRPRPALLVAFPVERGDEGKALRGLKPHAVDVVKRQQRHEGLTRARQSELVSCLVALIMSPPALSGATALAPDAYARSSRNDSSEVFRGWRALPNTFLR